MALATDNMIEAAASHDVDDIARNAAEVLLDDDWTGQGDVAAIGPDDLTPDHMAGLGRERRDNGVRTVGSGGSAVSAGTTE